MKLRRLTIWQQMVTPHMIPLAKALARNFEHARLVTLSSLDRERSAIGWGATGAPGLELVHAPDAISRGEALRDWTRPDDLHLLPGIKLNSWLLQVQIRLLTSPAKTALLSEVPWPPAGNFARGALALRERAFARLWRNRIEALFAIGEDAVEHFAKIGFPASIVHPFGYFPDLHDTLAQSAQEEAVTIALASTLQHHKGVDLLLSALARVQRPWRLRVVGDGPDRPMLEELASRLGIAERVEWLGWLQFERVPEFMSQAELLVVPSRYDGWGAVVNEALGVGTPVVASDAAGAHCVLTDPVLGESFKSGDVESLAATIRAQLDRRVTPERRRAICKWARQSLSPEVAAEYFLVALQGRAGPPPWRRLLAGTTS